MKAVTRMRSGGRAAMAGFGPLLLALLPAAAASGSVEQRAGGVVTYVPAPPSQPDTPRDNRPPDCSSVVAEPAVLWPPDRGFEGVSVRGARDADGDAVALVIARVEQDEPVSAHPADPSPDTRPAGALDRVELRRERLVGDGRLYRLGVAASDRRGGTCAATVRVAVPYMRDRAAVDSGMQADSSAVARSPLGAPQRAFTDTLRGNKSARHEVTVRSGVAGFEIVASWDYAARIDVVGIAIVRGGRVIARGPAVVERRPGKLRLSRRRGAGHVVVRVHGARPGKLRFRVRAKGVSRATAVRTEVRAIPAR